MSSQLANLQRRYGAELESSLKRWLMSGTGPGCEVLQMAQYHQGLRDEQLRTVESPGGKRFRPLLCMLTCEALGGRWSDALTAATAIELLHNFSLIHDDIEDRDPVRRHRPTVWALWGEPHAINAGDALFALAMLVIATPENDPKTTASLTREFAATALRLTQGQYLDMEFERRDEVTPNEYMTMIDGKSAALVSYSAWAGATVAGATDKDQRGMATFGHELGRAFQIYDDIRGLWGTTDETGKQAAGDLKNRKKTLPILLGLQAESGHPDSPLGRYIRGDSGDFDGALATLTSSRARYVAEHALADHLWQAEQALQSIDMDSAYRDRLTSLAADLTSR